jgi:hypothetical protein
MLFRKSGSIVSKSTFTFSGLTRRRDFNPRPFHWKFVVDKVVLGQAFLRVCRFSPISVILQILRAHVHVFNVVFAGRGGV